LIASRRDWHRSKGLLKGFKLALRPWESLKNWWRYDRMKFVTQCMWGVMNIEWDYNYYQPWSDNKWLVDEMLAMLDEDITM